MKKNRRIVLLSFLLMVVSPLVGNAAGKASPKKAVAVKPPISQKAVVVSPSGQDGLNSSERKDILSLIAEDNATSDIDLDAAWGDRNPFDSAAIEALPAIIVPVKKAEKDDRMFFLTGILWTGNRPSAIINDQVLGVGSVISGKTVKEIKENTVILVEGINQLDLLLYK